MNSNSSVRRRAVAAKATTIADIRARLAKRQEPTMAECSACHRKQEMPRYSTIALGMVESMWRCDSCGGNLFIAHMTGGSTEPSQDDDIQTLLDLIIAP